MSLPVMTWSILAERVLLKWLEKFLFTYLAYSLRLQANVQNTHLNCKLNPSAKVMNFLKSDLKTQAINS